MEPADCSFAHWLRCVAVRTTIRKRITASPAVIVWAYHMSRTAHRSIRSRFDCFSATQSLLTTVCVLSKHMHTYAHANAHLETLKYTHTHAEEQVCIAGQSLLWVINCCFCYLDISLIDGNSLVRWLKQSMIRKEPCKRILRCCDSKR